MSAPTPPDFHAASLVAVFVGIFGVQYGAYVAILLGSICGSIWAVQSAESMSRWQAAGLMFRSMLLSVLMTVAVSELLSKAFDWHVTELYIIVSIAISAMGDRWLGIIESLAEATKTAVSGMFKTKEQPK